MTKVESTCVLISVLWDTVLRLQVRVFIVRVAIDANLPSTSLRLKPRVEDPLGEMAVSRLVLKQVFDG